MQSSGSIKPAPKKSRKKLAGIVIAIIVVVLITATSVYIISAPRHHSYTLMASGDEWTLNPGGFYYVNFTVPSGAYSVSLAGSYVSSGDINAAVMTSSELSAFLENSSNVSNPIWYSGDGTGASFNVSLQPGTYAFLILNSNLYTSDTFTIFNAITLSYTSG
jgi:hypothetical protein